MPGVAAPRVPCHLPGGVQVVPRPQEGRGARPDRAGGPGGGRTGVPGGRTLEA
ncbi:hypothetical protein GCM10010425_23930 [Streptomyces spororaveus]|uniref:Uncharacterized protein n=1 Tax=Streptomyces spororaveus TaxID=284039 RepID=A0ABQ3TGY9_9ACTN|nr:hypothetical protein Sspor_52290 [Streptomyces spororaveus]